MNLVFIEGRQRISPVDLIGRVGAAAARREIADKVTGLIALLDMLDGDTDLEPETDRGIDDMPHDQGAVLLLQYGIDQTAGPINYREAEREHRNAELGFVRTATGWRLP